jgi:hypothetical protein
MSCCTEATGPRLSYSIVSCGTNWFDNEEAKIQKLADHGFCSITIVPEYPVWSKLKVGQKTITRGTSQIPNVEDIKILEENETNAAGENLWRYTPSIAQTEKLMREAIKKGFCVQLVPHVDSIGEFPDKVGDHRSWRGYFRFDPMGDYKTRIIDPLLEMAIRVIQTQAVESDPNCKPCVSFVLGAEVELSLVCHGAKWTELYDAANAQRETLPANQKGRLQFGHKVNHDMLSGFPSRLAFANEGGAGIANNQVALSAAMVYLAKLDFVSTSFYPALGETDDWDNDLSEDSTKSLSDSFKNAFRAFKNGLKEQMQKPLGAGSNQGGAGIGDTTQLPCFEIGEAGIGWLDPNKPNEEWNNVRPGAGEDPIKWMPPFDTIKNNIEQYRKIRCNYFAAFLYYLSTSQEDFAKDGCKGSCPEDFGTVSLWTNHWQFDLIGLILEHEPQAKQARITELFLDPEIPLNKKIPELLKAYNASLTSESSFEDEIRRRLKDNTGCFGLFFLILPAFLLILTRRVSRLFFTPTSPIDLNMGESAHITPFGAPFFENIDYPPISEEIEVIDEPTHINSE